MSKKKNTKVENIKNDKSEKVEEPKKKKNTFRNIVMWTLAGALILSLFLPALAGMM